MISSYPGINGAPHFSPDGNRLALALSMDGGNPNIYIMNIGARNLRQITKDCSINTEPAWSPDGTKHYFYLIEAVDLKFIVLMLQEVLFLEFHMMEITMQRLLLHQMEIR